MRSRAESSLVSSPVGTHDYIFFSCIECYCDFRLGPPFRGDEGLIIQSRCCFCCTVLPVDGVRNLAIGNMSRHVRNSSGFIQSINSLAISPPQNTVSAKLQRSTNWRQELQHDEGTRSRNTRYKNNSLARNPVSHTNIGHNMIPVHISLSALKSSGNLTSEYDDQASNNKPHQLKTPQLKGNHELPTN
jgi:hypothetical protein